MKILITLPVFVLACNCSQAQQTGKTYAETKREQDNRQYNKDYIEATKYNRNASTKNSSTGSGDKDAAKKLADQFSRNSGRMPDSDKEYWRLKEQTKLNMEQQRIENNRSAREFARAEAQRMKYVRQLEREKANADAARAVERNKMLEAGLTPPEAYNLAWYMIPGTGIEREPATQKFIADKMLWVSESYKQFVRSRDVEEYDTLAKLAQGFIYAGYSHVKAQQYLAIRFPAKEKETTMGMLAGMNVFYSGSFEVLTRAQYDNASSEQKSEMEALFLDIYQDYPAEALKACYTYERYNPVRDLFRKEKLQARKIEFAEMGLRIPGGERTEYLNYLNSFPGYFENKPVVYWNDHESPTSGGAATLITSLSKTYHNLHAVSFEKGKLEKIEISEDMKKSWSKLLKKIADSGNVSALNMVGVLAATGNMRKMDKEDAVDYWRKAAQAGSLHGYLNLLKANAAGYKNIPSVEILKQDFTAMISKADAEQLYLMACMIKDSYHGDMTQEIRKIGKGLADEAVAKGYKRAITVAMMLD